MNILDNTRIMGDIDKGNLYSSIEALPDQIDQAWREVKSIKLPDNYKDINNVVFAGMGGSALGGRIIDSLLTERVCLPIEISTDSRLPAYVNKHTLVILSSYSGNTDEIVEAGKEALKKQTLIFGITTGGKIAEFIKSNGLPGYLFTPTANPSKQPRMGLGYAITSSLALLSKNNLIHLTDYEIEEATMLVRSLIKNYSRDVVSKDNLVKMLAAKLYKKIPVLIASGHLYGMAHAVKNQLNENAKTFSLLFDIPEANHHLMEGLRNPAEVKRFLYFVFVESKLYTDFNQKRYPITKEIVEKNGIGTISLEMTSKDKLSQLFELLTAGVFLSYYLAMLYETDPTPIPWVDYFKENLYNVS